MLIFQTVGLKLIKIQYLYPWQIIKFSVHVLQDNMYFPYPNWKDDIGRQQIEVRHKFQYRISG